MDQSLLTGSIKFGSTVDEAPGPSLIEGTVSRERERERERRLFEQCRNLSVGHCATGVKLFKRCGNLSAGTVPQWCSC